MLPCFSFEAMCAVLTYVGVRITEWRGAEPTSRLGVVIRDLYKPKLQQ
jgi:hypothetical protein